MNSGSAHGCGARAWWPASNTAYAGLAFRHADGKVFKRSYFTADSLGSPWSPISGVATGPRTARPAPKSTSVTPMPPAALWFDDVERSHHQPGLLLAGRRRQTLAGAAGHHRAGGQPAGRPFQGSIRAVVARQQQDLPLTLEPGQAGRSKCPSPSRARALTIIPQPARLHGHPLARAQGQVPHQPAAGALPRLPLLPCRRRGQWRHAH